MPRSNPFAVRLLGVAFAATVLMGPLSPAGTPTAHAAPTDTPVPVATGNVETWAVGAGLLYWAHNCFADEFNPFAELLRKPSAGGPQRVIESINDGARCNTYHGLLSADDGLYYYDASGQRIARMPLGEPFTAQTVVALSASQLPYSSRAFVESGGYLYWVHFANKVFRTLKDGTGPIETVADTDASPTDVLVVGNYAYWVDATGVWTINVTCGALPCTGDRQRFAPFGANTVGYGLLYQGLGGVRGNYRVYWVERIASGANSDYRIRYRACNQISICTLDDPLLFYQSTTNWRIGNPVQAAGNVYWTEFDHTVVNSPNGDVKRRASTATAPGADTIATAQSRVDDQAYAAHDALFFARLGLGVYTLPLNAAPIVRDLRLDGVEVTQGIQDLGNGVPLVAEKTTYVRAYGLQLSGPSAPNVEARLAGTRGGVALPGSPLSAVKAVRALATGGSYDRAKLDDGWYFLLPGSWTTTGTTNLAVELDPRGNHSDPDRANNALSVAAVFRDQPPVCVMTVPVRTHTPLPTTGDPNFRTMIDHFHRRWPIPDVWVYRDTSPVEELEVCWYGPFPHPCFGPYELSDGWGLTNGIPDRDKVIASLWTRALLSFNPDACDDIGAPVHFMGMVHPLADNGGAAGYASTVSNQSWVQLPTHGPLGPSWDALREGSVMAQELAHNHGRKHVDCGGPDDIDDNYPYPPCQIGNVGPASHYGFDTRALQPIRPDQTADFMSYARRSWVSDYTWRALVGTISTAFLAAEAQEPGDAADGSGWLGRFDGIAELGRSDQDAQSVFITGLIDTANDRGALTQGLTLPTDSIPPATRLALAAQAAGAADALRRTPGFRVPGAPDGLGQTPAFHLRLLDAAGDLISVRPLTLNRLDDHSDEGDSALFSELFAKPAQPVAAVELWSEATRLDRVAPGAALPVVVVSDPITATVVADALTIRWTAHDPDADDRLRFTVQYSPDGGARWHTLAANVPARRSPGGPGVAISDTLELADLGTLHGSAPNAGLIRVLASDGLNTGIAASARFTLANRPPEVVISAPQSGEALVAGRDVLLMGSGLDAEDGGLTDDALAWQLDGVAVGTGRSLAVPGLAPGPRSASLAATDQSGSDAEATALFAIAPLAVPLGTLPLLDGACNDAAYAAGTSLQLAPYADGSNGTLRVLRTNDHLWACFNDLPRGTLGTGSRVELLVDADLSQDAQAQPGDLRLSLSEDGSVVAQVGDGAGGFTSPGPAGVSGQLSAVPGGWSGELRVAKARLGSWDRLVGLAFGHTAVASADDDHFWPYAAERGQPATWAASSLGDQPRIVALDPISATVGGAPFTLAIAGTGFISGTVALWGGTPLSTTFGDAEHITATVAAAQLTAAGLVQVTTRAPAPSMLTSNAVPFLVNAVAPVILGVSPTSVAAGAGVLALTVHGLNFGPDAEVLWNGMPLVTQVVSSARLEVQVPAELTANGQTVGIAVRNRLPLDQISGTVPFEIIPPSPGVPTATPTPSASTPSPTTPTTPTTPGTPVATDPPTSETPSASATPSPTGTAGPPGHPALYLPWTVKSP